MASESCLVRRRGAGETGAQRDEICFGTVLTILRAPPSTTESKVPLRLRSRGALVFSTAVLSCPVRSSRSRPSRAVPRDALLLPARAGRVVGSRFSLVLLLEASSRCTLRPRRSHRAHGFPQPQAKRSGAQSRFELVRAGVPTLPGP